MAQAPAPTDINWRNLQVHRCERLFRLCFTSLVSLIIIFICILLAHSIAAIIIYAVRHVGTTLEDKYPDYTCPNFEITAEMVVRN